MPIDVCGAKFIKCSYKSSPGYWAKFKCNFSLNKNVHCRCVIKILIDQVNGKNEILDETYIKLHSNDLHKKGCKFESTNEQLAKLIKSVDLNKLNERRSALKEEHSLKVKVQKEAQTPNAQLEDYKIKYEKLKSTNEVMLENFETRISEYKKRIDSLEQDNKYLTEKLINFATQSRSTNQ